ncbi:hypothetical protein AK812_SmicGene47785, partial [Symbiodinium microadriaticum]
AEAKKRRALSDQWPSAASRRVIPDRLQEKPLPHSKAQQGSHGRHAMRQPEAGLSFKI